MNDEPPEPPEIIIHSDNYTIDTPGGKRKTAPRRNGARVIVMVLFTWAVAALIATLIAGIISFLEVSRACERGLGDTGTTQAEVTFRRSIAVTCRTAEGSSFEIPMNGSAAVVLFSGFGLLVTLLLLAAYAAIRNRPNA